jgi:basic amino acid/polyamine antiporter, APA family
MRLCLGEFSYHAGPFVTDSSASLSSAKPLSSPAEFGRPRQTLGIADVLAITVGIVIGAGIFRTPALVAGAAGGDETLLLAVWALGGLLSIIGALCYAELASAYPNMGGDYHFLGRAYGQRTAFFYAWARLAVIQTGSLALLAYVFADYMVAILPASGPPVLWAAIAVIGVSALNWLGVRQGAAAQKWLTIAEVVGLIVVIVAGLLLAPEGAAPRPVTGESAVGMMMIFVLLTYGGWNEAVYVSAEMKNAPRRIAPVMVGGLLIVTVLYLLANMAFLRVLGIGGMAETDAVAAGVMNAAMGDAGAAIVSLIIAVAALTSANATALTGARTTCALGRRFSLLSWLGKWDVKRDTPGNAMIAGGRVRPQRVSARGRLYRAGILAVPAADRPVAVRAAREGARPAPPVPRAALPDHASNLLRDDRLSLVVERHLYRLGRLCGRRGAGGRRRDPDVHDPQ